MEYRRLGASGVRVSEIALGSWLTYGVGVEADVAKACVAAAYELGV
ncbi:MAG TPA: aldo/keto reductase, partial [Actinomycetota bacterium]|nr:aldo/keto reductase [Actinomycetota bacterium]